MRPSECYPFCVLYSFCRWFNNIGVNAVGVTGVRTPSQYLTSRGPSMCWTRAIILTQSRIRCTIFVNIIDFVVTAVVEQVYSSTFKFCLLKMQEICPLKRFIFTSTCKCTKMRLLTGLRPDPLEELSAYSAPQTPS